MYTLFHRGIQEDPHRPGRPGASPSPPVVAVEADPVDRQGAGDVPVLSLMKADPESFHALEPQDLISGPGPWTVPSRDERLAGSAGVRGATDARDPERIEAGAIRSVAKGFIGPPPDPRWVIPGQWR